MHSEAKREQAILRLSMLTDFNANPEDINIPYTKPRLQKYAQPWFIRLY